MATKAGILGRKIALLAGSLVMAIVLAEIAIRLLGAAPELSRIDPGSGESPYRVSENPFLGYVYKANHRIHRDDPSRPALRFTNANGFRDIDRAARKPDGVKRILLLGDSVVAGDEYIPSPEDSLSLQLERLLESRNIEVLNMGVSGYCTRAEVELLKEEGLRFDPDLVVLVFVYNDYDGINVGLSEVTLSAPMQFFFVHSHLFRYCGVRFNLFHLRTHFGVQEVAGEFIGPLVSKDTDRRRSLFESADLSSATVRNHVEAYANEHAEGESNVHSGLRLLKALSEEHGFDVAIGHWPLFSEYGIADVEGGYPPPHYIVEPDETLLVEKLAVDHGFRFFRFSEHFNRDYEARRVRAGGAIGPANVIYAMDTMHPNVLAAGVAADAIVKFLEANPDLLE